MKRKLTTILALLLLAQTSVSCGDSGSSSDTTTAGSNDSSETTPEVTTEAEPLVLPEGLDYNDYEFRVFSRIGRYETEIYVEEQTGSLVNDKTFERNHLIEELLGIKFVPVYSDKNNYEADSVKPILANEDAYDLLFTHGRAAFLFGSQGAGLNWHDVPNVNLEHSYWNQDFIDNMTVNGQLFALAGDFSWANLSFSGAMVFSKELFDDHQVAYPYDDVVAGTWTFDKFQSVAKQFTQDIDNDGTFSKDKDLFGYLAEGWSGPIEILYSTGGRVVTPDKNGVPQLTLYNERTVNALERYTSMLREDYAKFSAPGNHTKAFFDGRVAMIDTIVVYLGEGDYVDADMEFGLIPWPKYDESLDRYYGYVDAGSTLAFVPVTVTDPARSGAVAEAMAYYGKKMIIPAYYDVTLQNRYLRDDMSVQMLDYIAEGRTFDLAYWNNAQYGGSFANVGRNLVMDETLNFTSFYEANKSSVETLIEKSNAYYLGDE